MDKMAETAKPPEELQKSIITMAVECWRFSRSYQRLLLKLDAGEGSRYLSQLYWFVKKLDDALEQAGLHMVNVEGQPFDPGMAATPLNIEDFEANDTLEVEQMLEPIIMSKAGLVKTGTVILRKVAA